jgi:hypothetical protein
MLNGYSKIILLISFLAGSYLVHGQGESIITTSRSAPIGVISYAAAVTSSGFADAKYVDGYVKKMGTTKFIFPVGDEGLYRPFAAAANGTTGAYYRENPSTTVTGLDVTGGPFPTTFKGEGVGNVSGIEFWDINGTQPTRITLTWAASSNINALIGDNNLSKLLIVGFNGTSWVKIPATVDATAVLGGSSTITAGSITTNDALVPDTYRVYSLAAEPGGPLPVTLISFEAKAVENFVETSWSTSHEVNNDHFEVERRMDSGWETIGKVERSQDAGIRRYRYVDERPLAGENLYRLKMVDLDGTFAHSRIVSVQFAGKRETLSLYPNPVSDRLFIKTDKNLISEISIINMQGRQVLNQKTLPVDGINVIHLSAGTYVVLVKESNGSTSSHKVIISH